MLQRIELEELCLKNHVKIESALNRLVVFLDNLDLDSDAGRPISTRIVFLRHRGIEQDFLVPQRNKIEKWLKEKNQSSSNTLVLECQGGTVFKKIAMQ